MSALLFSQRFPSGKRPVQNKAIVNPQSIPSNKKNLRLIIIREELVNLTGEPWTAAVLGQFMYWSHQLTDFKQFIKEEMNSSKGRCAFKHGWFHKSAQEFIEETKLSMSIVSFHRYLSFLIDRGWVQIRPQAHPQIKWDRRIHYRVNLRKLSTDLQKIGHSLPGFAFNKVSKQSTCEDQKESLVSVNDQSQIERPVQ